MVRVTEPEALDVALRELLPHDGPALLDVVTNPEAVSLPPKVTAAQSWGFAIAKADRDDREPQRELTGGR